MAPTLLRKGRLMGVPVTLTDPQGNYVEIGGGGSSTVAVSNFPASQPVTGPLTNAQLRAADVGVYDSNTATILNELNTDFGMPSEPAWSGSGNGTVIAILKALHAQNAQIIAVLNQIQDNTASG